MDPLPPHSRTNVRFAKSKQRQRKFTRLSATTPDGGNAPRRHLERDHYSNCTMLSPTGKQMCRIAMKRANWYITHDLAQVVQESPMVIQLTFEPNGDGCSHDPFYMMERKNQCVVCGSTEGMTRHHCVPFCFRRYFPSEYKENTSHDILLVCAQCHEDYEKVAHMVKEALLRQAGTEVQITEPLRAARKAAFTIYHYNSYIPEERELALRELVGKVYGFPVTDDLVIQVLIEDEAGVGFNGGDLPDPWKHVVDQIKDLPTFIRSWRKHFVDIMCPLYLPEHWSVEGRYQK